MDRTNSTDLVPEIFWFQKCFRRPLSYNYDICGNNPYSLAKCAQLLEEQTDADFIDVNLGCPLDTICKTGCGSALLKKDRFLKKTLQCMVLATDMPITIKTRIGFRKSESFLHKYMEDLGNIGLSLITIHGRTKEQRYTKTVDWPYIGKCVGLVKSTQTAVFGNGDIFSYEDYNSVRENYKDLSGAMIGRAALIKPWIFTEIKEQKHIDISSQERFQLLQKYVNYGLEHWGSDTMGVEMTRRFLLEWLSFLCRYTPVGILEHVPQKINQRVPSYVGRDDLETLFASQNCSDWIKISEMFLGRVPDGFQFLPKHKASAWR